MKIPWWVWAIAAGLSWWIPDPLPFVDEVALTAIAIWSYMKSGQ